MTVDRRLMEQALESLQTILGYRQTFLDIHQVMEDLKTRLEQPQREWHGLTDEERKEIIRKQKDFWGPVGWELECAKAIEAKLMEKNFDRPS